MKSLKNFFYSRSFLWNQMLFNFMLLFLAWSGLFRRSFNCDTLTHIAYPGNDIMWRVMCGRYLAGALDYILYQLGTSAAAHTGITTLIEVLMLTVAATVIQRIFLPRINKKSHQFIFMLITSLSFVNVLYAEPMMFGECAIMFGSAYLLSSVGVYFFTKRKYLFSFLFFLLSTMEYQVAVVYGAIIISVWIFLENDCIITKKTVWQELLCGIFTFGSGFLNMMSLNFISKLGIIENNAKSPGISDFPQKIMSFTQDLLSIFKDSKGVLPDLWLPLIVTLAAVGVTLWVLIKDKNMSGIVYYILLVLGLFVFLYTIPMMQYDLSPAPRMVFLFYTIQAMLLLIAFLFVSDNLRIKMGYLCGLYLAFQIMFCNIIVANHMISNTLDETYAMMVYEKILEYEKETGNSVTKLAVVNDIDCPLSYESVSYKTHQINERALGIVTNTLVNVVSGRDFQKVTMDEEIHKQYFEGKNWDYFDATEQLIIIGDTAYWAIF